MSTTCVANNTECQQCKRCFVYIYLLLYYMGAIEGAQGWRIDIVENISNMSKYQFRENKLERFSLTGL